MRRWFRDWVAKQRRRLRVVELVMRHPKTPWYAKAVGGATLLYALSPIDLIPDFIPVIGHLDDLLLVPLGLWLTISLVPEPVWKECREKAELPAETIRTIPPSCVDEEPLVSGIRRLLLWKVKAGGVRGKREEGKNNE